MNFILSNLYTLLAVSAVLHVVEEFVYPGGFAKDFRGLLSRFGLTITNFQIVFINTLFFGLIILVLFSHKNAPITSLAAVFLVGLNGIIHTITSVGLRKYFPGLITGALLYIPLGVIAWVYSPGDSAVKFNALIIAFLLHTIPIIVVFTGKLFSKKLSS